MKAIQKITQAVAEAYQHRAPIALAKDEDFHVDDTSLVERYVDHKGMTPPPEGTTPLMFAARQGHIEMAALLLDAGADISAANASGATALHFAMSAPAAEKKALLRLLLDRGADINAPDRIGRTPLMMAVANNDVAAVQFLLDHGADLNAVDKYGRTADDIARANPDHLPGRARVIALLLQEECFRHAMEQERQRLAKRRVAVNAGSQAPVQPTAQTGGWREVASKMDDLWGRVFRSSATFVQGLHKHQQIRATIGGVTPLMMVARQGCVEMADMLLAAGARIDARNEAGMTALHYAIGFEGEDRRAIVSYLLSRHADVNAQNDDGKTPLMLAVALGHTEAVSLLLQTGADTELRDINGATAEDLARLDGRWDLVHQLQLHDHQLQQMEHGSRPVG